MTFDLDHVMPEREVIAQHIVIIEDQQHSLNGKLFCWLKYAAHLYVINVTLELGVLVLCDFVCWKRLDCFCICFPT